VSTAGRIHALLVVLALAACVVVGIALWLGGETRAPAAAIPDAPAPRTAAPAIEPVERSPDSAARVQSAANATDPAGQFDGRGAIRGEILVRGGARVPDRWTLIVGPHPWLEGHDRAESRRVEFEHGETQFAVEGLPLGGYLVRAQAGAQNCVPGNVLLVRDSADVFVSLLLTPSGFIDGGVIDADGRPAEGLDVTLDAIATHERATISTDAAGAFVFRDVLDGEYRLSFGRPDSPLVPAQALVFQAPSLRFPTRTLPPTGALKFTVTDVRMRPMPRAHISGSATGSGTVDTFTDTVGIAHARFLPLGHYRIDARSEEGFEASASIDLQAGKELPLVMVVQDRTVRR
jgi:hypothetical protein